MRPRFRENLFVLDKVSSTNELLMRAPLSEYPMDTALLALQQSQGRGRAEREWSSPPGGMYLSVLFLPREVEGLALLGALCVVEMCRREFSLPALIRWPNDVYLEGRKLAGVLAQVQFQGQKVVRAVLGVGLNVSQSTESFAPELRSTATTLSHHRPSESWQVEEVARLFLLYLERELDAYGRDGNAALFARCEQYLEGLDPPMEAYLVSLQSRRPLGGIKGLDSKGELILADGTRLRHLGPQERLVLS